MDAPIDPTSTLGLQKYYSDLLIFQYVGKPKAYATVGTFVGPILMPQDTVQRLDFSLPATGGAFVIEYNGNLSPAIDWFDSAATIQTKLQSVPGLGSVRVSGTISSAIDITFIGVAPPVPFLIINSNTLTFFGDPFVVITMTETDQTLPLAIQNAFNITGPNPAVGKQLDILGKYCGVIRNVNGPYGPISLDDADFLTLIKFAIVQNNSGSSLYDIETNMDMFFPGQFLITDYQNMNMSYILSTALGSSDLFLALVTENLLPRPMGVGVSVFLVPNVDDFFGFSTYDSPNLHAKPFNTYDDFNMTWFFLSYGDAL